MGDRTTLLFDNGPKHSDRPMSLQQADQNLHQALQSKDKTKVDAALKDEYNAYAGQAKGNVGTKEFNDHLNTVAGGQIPSEYTSDVQGLMNWESGLQPSVSSAVWGDDMSNASWKDNGMTLYPSGAPSTTDINQHGIGDCDVDSALASWAHNDPQAVMSHITQNGTGPDATYTVKMVDPNGAPVDITVDGKMLVDKNGGPVSGSSADGTANWTTVMEKALAKYDDTYGLGAIGGEGSEKAMKAFTGTSSTFGLGSGTATVGDVEANVNQGNVVTGGFSQEMTLPNGDTVISGHGYAVLGVVEENGQKYVEMRNPWGVVGTDSGGYNKDNNGIVKIPQEMFEKYCDLRVISANGSPLQAPANAA